MDFCEGKNALTYVYWLHLPEHTDANIEGYVGVSRNPSYRLWEHRNDVKKDNHCNPYLSRVIKKYSNNLTQTILFEGSEEECYDYEEKLRPIKNIGWNLNKGGFHPPSASGRVLSADHKVKIGKSNTGKKHPHNEEAKQKISQARKGISLSNVTKEKISDKRKSQVFSENTKQKMSDSHKGIVPGNAKTIKTPLGTFTSIKKAAKAYNLSRFKFENYIKHNPDFSF